MDRQQKKGRHSGQEAQQEQRLGGRRIREPRLVAGRGMCLGALRAQWDYNPDWFDRRHGGKNEMSVLITSSPLVSDGKMEAARCKVSLVTRSCPESTAPWPPSCCLFKAAWPLAPPVLTAGLTFQWPVSLNSSSCRRAPGLPTALCPSSDCPSPPPWPPCTPTFADARSRSWRYLARWTGVRTRGSLGRSSLWL